MRVACAEFAAVVETTPRSVKMAVARAPASSSARMSRRSETPVALRPSMRRPWWANSRTIAHAAAVLPQFMQLPTMATTGMPLRSSAGRSGSLSPPILAGRPMRSPSTGKLSTAPSTSHSKGLPRSGLTESQIPNTPPRFNRWTTSPGARRSGILPE